MQHSKNIFRIVGACTLLLIFLVKLNSPINKLLKIQKAVVTSVNPINDAEESQDDLEKKNNGNFSSDFNKEFDNLLLTFPGNFAYLVISNANPNYFSDFVVGHYPPVPTPPPNC